MVAIRPIKSREVTVTCVVAVAFHAAASMETGEPGVGAAACAVGWGTLRGIGTAFQVQSHSVQTHSPQATHEGAPLKLRRSIYPNTREKDENKITALLSTSLTFSLLIFTTILWGMCCYYPSFSDEISATSSEMLLNTLPKVQSSKCQNWSLSLGLSVPKAHALSHYPILSHLPL